MRSVPWSYRLLYPLRNAARMVSLAWDLKPHKQERASELVETRDEDWRRLDMGA